MPLRLEGGDRRGGRRKSIWLMAVFEDFYVGIGIFSTADRCNEFGDEKIMSSMINDRTNDQIEMVLFQKVKGQSC